jgi:hypothetical protein
MTPRSRQANFSPTRSMVFQRRGSHSSGLDTTSPSGGADLMAEVSFGQRNDGLGEVALGDTTGPTGRVGLRGKWTVTAGDQVWQPYVRANLWQDWGRNANTVYSGRDMVPLVKRATLLELAGVTGRINANVSVFASVHYEFQVGGANGERQNGVRGAFGARYTW